MSGYGDCRCGRPLYQAPDPLKPSRILLYCRGCSRVASSCKCKPAEK